MDELQAVRERYAEELRYQANLRSNALIRAFAEVRRETFLGPGPWRVYNTFGSYYWTTPDDDPRHVYHDVLVAVDEGRQLNNGSRVAWRFLSRLWNFNRARTWRTLAVAPATMRQ